MSDTNIALKDAWDYIEKEYSIPVWAVAVPFAGVVGAAAAAIPTVLGALTVSKINKQPDDLFKTEASLFYKVLCQNIDANGMSETEVYNKAKVSRQVYSNIRSMATKKYTPSKTTVLCLCIALKLKLERAQELLAIVGYTLSNNEIVDKVVSWFLEQTNVDYDVDVINDYIFDNTKGEFCLFKA